MSTAIRLPNITGRTESEQISQLRSYLFQLVEQLNWIFSVNSFAAAEVPAAPVSGSNEDIAGLKSQVVKATAKINEYIEKLDGCVLDTDFEAYKKNVNETLGTLTQRTGVEYVTEAGTFDTALGTWHYRKWSSGACQMHGSFAAVPTATEARAALHRTNSIVIPIPFAITGAAVAGTVKACGFIQDDGAAGQSISVRIVGDAAFGLDTAVEFGLQVTGTCESEQTGGD